MQPKEVAGKAGDEQLNDVKCVSMKTAKLSVSRYDIQQVVHHDTYSFLILKFDIKV